MKKVTSTKRIPLSKWLGILGVSALAIGSWFFSEFWRSPTFPSLALRLSLLGLLVTGVVVDLKQAGFFQSGKHLRDQYLAAQFLGYVGLLIMAFGLWINQDFMATNDPLAIALGAAMLVPIFGALGLRQMDESTYQSASQLWSALVWILAGGALLLLLYAIGTTLV